MAAYRSGASVSAGLVLVRLSVGLLLARHGWIAFMEGGVDAPTIRRGVRSVLEDTNALFAWWGESVLLANPDAIAFLWNAAALVCGLCLLAGALTRPAGALASLFLLNAIVFAPPGHEHLYGLLMVCSLACSVSGAGRRVGLDSMLDENLPAWLSWTRGGRGRSIF